MPFRFARIFLIGTATIALAGCNSSSSVGDPAGFQYNAPGSASAKVNAELDAEATAFGTAQGAAGIAAAMDPTGLSTIPLTVGGGIAHKAWLAKNDARMQAVAEEDIQAAYRKYGMNPDGTPSGKRGPGSATAN
ncbi:hypothetical protein [Microvirga flavescens]|uniref:hypothetical protein n=1 Tax=Microvirga flavescens TaxID=2249811 RepID=UPI0013001B2D|nr:hypothetical protein [Microvirga flavescens]